MCSSFIASGLYILYTKALPIPNSTNDNIVKTLENNPFNPKYSAPNVLVNTVLQIKLTNRYIIWHSVVIKTFFMALFVREFCIFIPYPNLNFVKHIFLSY